MARDNRVFAATRTHRIRAVAFDAFVVFDPRPAARLCEQLFPGRGNELATLWRTRQFEYQWLRALSGAYADFPHTTAEALVFAAESLHLDLTPEHRHRLMNASLELHAWPDAKSGLEQLRHRGYRLALLSNATREMLNNGIANASLENLFDHVLSTDDLRSYKPAPRAYGLGPKAFKLPKQEIAFVASAGWDAAGAKMYGYPTYWVNRTGSPVEELEAPPDAVVGGLYDLVDALSA